MLSVFRKIVRTTGRGLALQECLYGFIMTLLFIFAGLFGLISGSKEDFIILILGMDVTWGVIDMIVYYLVDRSEQRKYLRILTGECSEDKRMMIKNNLSGTIVDLIDERDEEKIIDLIMEGRIEPHHEIRAERLGLLKSAAMCALITAMTAVPAVISLIFVPGYREALIAAALSSAFCMFFIGYGMGPYLGIKRWRSALFLLILTVAITLAATFTGG